MDIGSWIAALGGVIAMLGSIIGVVLWVWRTGQTHGTMISTLNNVATDVSEVRVDVKTLMDTRDTVTGHGFVLGEHGRRLDDHGIRISELEKKKHP